MGGNMQERLRSEEEYIQELKEQDKNERIKKLMEIFGPDAIDTNVLNEQVGVIDSAATIIQKFWRGFFTRKIVRQYLEFLQVNYGENYA